MPHTRIVQTSTVYARRLGIWFARRMSLNRVLLPDGGSALSEPRRMVRIVAWRAAEID